MNQSLDFESTALVINDPHKDLLDRSGAAWGYFGENALANNTVENIERLFQTAKANGLPVFVSPHHYFPHDDHWIHRGPILQALHDHRVLSRKGPMTLDGYEGSGADFLDRFKPYILDGQTVIVNPHKLFGPESNDLVLQLRLRGVSTVILGGPGGNLCTESHLRALVENGFFVAIVKDAVAAPGADAYRAAVINYEYIANAVWTTDEAVQQMEAAEPVLA